MRITYFFLFIIFFLNESAIADSGNGRAEIYKVTMNLMQLCTDSTCTTPTTVCNTTKTVDIASVNAGAEIGTWCSMSGLPLGTTYTHLRVRLSRTFYISGIVLNFSGTKDCHTQDDNSASLTKLAPGVQVTDDSTTGYVEQKVVLCNGDNSTACDSQSGSSNAYFRYSNGPSDLPSGAISWCAGNTTAHASTVDGNGDAASGVCVDGDYSNTWDDIATADTIQIIYKLLSPYTVGLISPKLKLAFNTSEALIADNYDADYCELRPGSPTVTISLTN